jgi:hypothetical protein
MRDDDRSRFKRGALLSAAGAVALVGGIAWMFIDSIVHDRPPPDTSASASGAKLFVGEAVW